VDTNGVGKKTQYHEREAEGWRFNSFVYNWLQGGEECRLSNPILTLLAPTDSMQFSFVNANHNRIPLASFARAGKTARLGMAQAGLPTSRFQREWWAVKYSVI
jgi:hypothetical protein